MSVFASVGILLFAMLILGFLQLVPGIFLLFRHHASGKYSRSRASDQAAFFIFGVETAVILVFLFIYLILSYSPALVPVFDSNVFTWIMASIAFILSLVTCFGYFRPGPGTKLFISRKVARQYQTGIKTTKSRSDAFVLGLTTIAPELVFTLPLYILATIEIMRLGPDCFSRAGLIILFAIATILPLIIIHALWQHYNLADFIRFRFKNKAFFRFTLSFAYFAIAVLIIIGALL